MLKNIFCLLFSIASAYAASMTCSFTGTACSSIQTLTPSATPNEVITVTNAPSQPFIDTVTTRLSLPKTGITLNNFPGGLFGIFRSLQDVSISSFSTSLMGTDSIYNCGYLTQLSFGYSTIGRLGAGFARTCINMTSFLIQFSSVGSIDALAFDGLVNLQKLYMYGSKITYLPATLIKPLKALTLVNFDNNPIVGLNSQFFAGLPLLTSATFHGTVMTYLPNFNFTGTAISPAGSSLQLIMYNNPIKAINPKLFDQLIARRAAGQNQIYIYFKSIDGTITNCVNPAATFANNLYIISGSDLTSQKATFASSTTCFSDITEYVIDIYNTRCGSGSC